MNCLLIVRLTYALFLTLALLTPIATPAGTHVASMLQGRDVGPTTSARERLGPTLRYSKRAFSLVEYPLPTTKAGPVNIVSGPDGALWFTEFDANQIGRITLEGDVTEYPVPTASAHPAGITPGPDGALWFTERYKQQIGRVDTVGNMREYRIHGYAGSITTGPDAALWFTDAKEHDKIGRISTSGQWRLYHIHNTNRYAPCPTGITSAQNELWFSEECADFLVDSMFTNGENRQHYLRRPHSFGGLCVTSDALGNVWVGVNYYMVRYGLKGHKRVYGLPYGGPGGSGDAPFYLAAAPDGSVWYTQVGSGQTSISHLSLNGQVTQYPYVGDYAGLVVGGDGALWFADYGNDAIARLSP